jgi:hypothetical protein
MNMERNLMVCERNFLDNYLNFVESRDLKFVYFVSQTSFSQKSTSSSIKTPQISKPNSSPNIHQNFHKHPPLPTSFSLLPSIPKKTFGNTRKEEKLVIQTQNNKKTRPQPHLVPFGSFVLQSL